MGRMTVILVVAAAALGLLGGFLWWGRPAGHLEAELHDVRGSAERLSQELDDLRTRDQRLSTQLKDQQARLDATERDLHTEKQMNSRLHLLVSEGRK